MNHKDNPDSNAMFESESPETQQQLEALEQRLRVTRPQLSRLDAATLMREADQRLVNPRTSVALRRVWLAGSWACGVAIGALVMFVLMNQTTSEAAPEGPVDSRSMVTVVDDHVVEPLLSPGNRFENEDASESSDAFSMSPIDLLDDSHSGYLVDGGTLQVGKFLRQLARHERHVFVRQNQRGLNDVGPDQLSPSVSQPDLDPTPPIIRQKPITRQQMWQELLEYPFGAIL